jgi:DedD protein
MAETPLSQEELALRRRARRRLVGAIALAMLAVVVLPMVFDPEPRPLGGNVEIDIPPQTAPFEPSAPTLAPAAALQEHLGQPVAQPAPPVVAEPPPAPVVQPEAAKPPVEKPAETKPVAIKPPPTKPAPPAPAKAKPADTGEVYLQLGVFSSVGNAKTLADKAKAAGFSAGVASAGGKSRVRVGPYPDRDQALAAQAKLKAKGFNSVISGP